MINTVLYMYNKYVKYIANPEHKTVFQKWVKSNRVSYTCIDRNVGGFYI